MRSGLTSWFLSNPANLGDAFVIRLPFTSRPQQHRALQPLLAGIAMLQPHRDHAGLMLCVAGHAAEASRAPGEQPGQSKGVAAAAGSSRGR